MNRQNLTKPCQQRWTCVRALFLAVLVAVAYAPVRDAGYIWDDDDYVTENSTLATTPATDGLWRIWFEPQSTPQYYPLVHTSFWIEYRLWRLHPLGYHINNVVIHFAAALLFWAVLARLGLPGAFAGAAVFAVHPVMVESVAWVTERKNVLSLLFYFAAMWTLIPAFGLTADDRESPRSFGMGRYVAGFGFFVLALLSKTVTCSLPAALAVMIWWRRGAVTRLEIVRLLPMFAVGLALALHTAHLERQHVGASGAEWDFTFADRLLIACRAVWFYFGKLLWPEPLAFIYPRWTIDAAVWWQWLFVFGVLALVGGLWAVRGRLGRGPLAAALLFGGALFPALGFFNVYPMRYSFVADHFQYHASTAVIAFLVCGLASLLERHPRPGSRYAGPVLLGVTLLVFTALTHRQARVYESAETLWRDNLAKNPGCWMCHNNLGKLLVERRTPEDTARAADHFAAAVALYPEYEMLVNLGQIRAMQGRRDRAIALYRQALEVNPGGPTAMVHLAAALVARFDDEAAPDDEAEAVALLERILDERPDHVASLIRLSRLLAGSESASIIDRPRAIALGEDACVRTGFQHPPALAALAYAYHLDGREIETRRLVEDAVTLAQEAGDRATLERLRRDGLWRLE